MSPDQPEQPHVSSEVSEPPRSALRWLWLALGWFALGLGVIGIVLPIMPTTPFVILATFCFAKSSPALALRLRQSKVYGPIIADWQANGAIAPRYKAISVTMMAAALGLSVYMAVPHVVLGVQSIVMAAAATFILSRPSRARTANSQIR